MHTHKHRQIHTHIYEHYKLSTYICIQVISGQHLPKPLKGSATGEIIDPYVKLEVKGSPCDSKDFKTKYVSDNGMQLICL